MANACTVSRTSCTRTTAAPRSTARTAAATLAGNREAASGATPSASVAAAAQPSATAPAKVGHQAAGSVDSIDLKAGTLSLNHGPVATLKWPAMTMEFKAANPALLKGLMPGQPVRFEFVERQPGEYVVTSISAAPVAGSTPAAVKATSASAAAAGAHSGH